MRTIQYEIMLIHIFFMRPHVCIEYGCIFARVCVWLWVWQEEHRDVKNIWISILFFVFFFSLLLLFLLCLARNSLRCCLWHIYKYKYSGGKEWKSNELNSVYRTKIIIEGKKYKYKFKCFENMENMPNFRSFYLFDILSVSVYKSLFTYKTWHHEPAHYLWKLSGEFQIYL